MEKINNLAAELRTMMAEYIRNNNSGYPDTFLETRSLDALYIACTTIRKPKEKTEKPGCYVIYTDGGYSMQNNVGAGSFVVIRNGEVVSKGGEKVENATNNVAELTAVKCALRKLPDGSSAEIHSDSQYTIGVLGKNWKPKKNIELIEEIKDYMSDHNLTVSFEWVKGHSGDKYNEMCDSMCNAIAGVDLNSEYARFKR